MKKKFKKSGHIRETAHQPKPLQSPKQSQPVESLLVQAIHYQRTGDLSRAEALYRQVLEQDPQNADALHLLGVIANQVGKPAVFVELIRKAITYKPFVPSFHYNLGKVYRTQGKLTEAITCFRQAVYVKPDFIEAHANLGFVLQAQGNLPEALDCYQTALRLKPDWVEGYFYLGTVFKMQGKLEEAISSFQTALQLWPDFLEVHYHLATVLHQQGNLEAAITHYQEVVRLKPELVEGHVNLGVLLRSQGKLDEAVRHLQQAVQLQPDCVEAHYNLGNALHDQGNLPAALIHFQEAVRLQPALAEAHVNLGVILQEQGKLGMATQCFRTAVRLKPESIEAHYNLGNALHDQGNLPAALTHYREAVRLQPDFLKAHINIASVLQGRGNFTEAMASYEQVLQLDAHCEEAYAGIARILEKKGEFQEAYDLLRPLIDAGTRHTSILTTFALVCRHFDRHAEAIAFLEEHLARESLSREQRRGVLFTLGKLCDELMLFDKAFLYYQQANALKPLRFDPDAHIAFIDALIGTHTPDLLARLPRATHQSERLVFIIGMMRSGTSLVEQILASHPAVYGAGELHMISQLAASLPTTLGTTQSYPYCLESLSPEALDAMAYRYLEHLDTFSGEALHITDKMPGNFLYLGLIALLFPQARIIHCRRDPLDTCLSCYFQDFIEGHAYTYNLSHLGLYYTQYERLMQHWKAVLTVPMLEVHYEELVAHQVPVSQQIIAFCGLEWNESCLRFHETKRYVNTASYDQIRRPLYSTSVGRHWHYAPYLEPLKIALSHTICSERLLT